MSFYPSSNMIERHWQGSVVPTAAPPRGTLFTVVLVSLTPTRYLEPRGASNSSSSEFLYSHSIFLHLHSLLFVPPLIYFLPFCLHTTSFEHLVFWSKMSFISFLRLSWRLIILQHLNLYSHTFFFLSYSYILYSNTASFQRVMLESFIHVFHCIISKAREQN